MNITFINRMMGINFGGGENFDLNIARALKRRGHNIRFFVGRKLTGLALRISDNDFETIYIKTPYIRGIHYRVKPTNIIKKLISVLALELDLWIFERAVLNRLSSDSWSDIYQVCGLPRLGALLKKQAIQRGINAKSVVRWPGPPSKRYLKWMRQCDANFANGDAFRFIRENLYQEVENIPLGIDLEKFYQVEKTDRPYVEFTFVGRITPIKNLPFLIRGFNEALKKNNRILLNIVGGGDESEIKIVKQLIEKNQNIRFLGERYGAQLIEIYQRSDVFILTSSYDNFPNVIFEAMACGLPVIATSVGGIKDQVIDGETGILIQPGNIEDLKNAILKLASDKELRERMGQAGRRRVEQEFSWDKSAEKLEKLYERLLQ